MAVIDAWTSQADFYTVGTNAANTTAAQIAPYALEGFTISSVSSFARVTFPAAASIWCQFYYYPGTVTAGTTGLTFWQLKDTEAGTPLFRLRQSAAVTGSIVLEYWNGSAWTSGGASSAVMAATTRYKFDVKLIMDNSVGEYLFYINDALILSYSGDTVFTAATTVTTLELMSPSNTGTNNFSFSGVIIASEDTRAMVFHQAQATAAGANTAWTGTYTDVTELGRDDGDLIESGSANQVETYVMDNVNAALSEYSVRAVVLGVRSRKGTTGPQNMQGAVRQSGTDFFTSNVSGLSPAYSSHNFVLTTNPATSAEWTIAEIDADEFGLKSIT